MCVKIFQYSNSVDPSSIIRSSSIIPSQLVSFVHYNISIQNISLNYLLSPFLVKSNQLSNPFYLTKQPFLISRLTHSPRRQKDDDFAPISTRSELLLCSKDCSKTAPINLELSASAASPPATNLFFFFHDLVTSRSKLVVFLSSLAQPTTQFRIEAWPTCTRTRR